MLSSSTYSDVAQLPKLMGRTTAKLLCRKTWISGLEIRKHGKLLILLEKKCLFESTLLWKHNSNLSCHLSNFNPTKTSAVN